MKRLLTCTLMLTATCVAAEDKTLKLYNWADYFAADTLANSPPRPVSR